MDHFQKISQQTGWQIIGKVATSLSTVIVLTAVTRNFGATGTGILTLSLTYLSFFILLADFGLNARALPEFLKSDITLAWQKLLGLRLMLTTISLIFALTLVLLWPGINNSLRWTILIGLAGILQGGVLVTATAVFQSKLRYDLLAWVNLGGTLTTLLAVFLLVKLKINVPVLMAGYVSGWLVVMALALSFARKFVADIRPTIDLGYSLGAIKQSWPISLALLLNLVYFRLDAFILSFFRGLAEVGIYNVAFQMFQTALVIPTFIMNSYYPIMLKELQSNRDKFLRLLNKSGLAMIGLGLLGTVATLLIAPSVADLVTGGKGFSGTVDSLRILSLSFPAFFLSSLLMWVMIIQKKYLAMLAIYLAGLTVNAVLNWAFIPKFSYIASSWVTGVCEYLILVSQLVILVPELKKWRK